MINLHWYWKFTSCNWNTINLGSLQWEFFIVLWGVLFQGLSENRDSNFQIQSVWRWHHHYLCLYLRFFANGVEVNTLSTKLQQPERNENNNTTKFYSYEKNIHDILWYMYTSKGKSRVFHFSFGVRFVTGRAWVRTPFISWRCQI